MPRNGAPLGCTPIAASASTADGIRPWAPALSAGVPRGSTTVTVIPARRARMATARPTGPPPATSRSVTPASRSCAGPGDLGQQPVLAADPGGQDGGVGDREQQRGQPGGADQRQ